MDGGYESDLGSEVLDTGDMAGTEISQETSIDDVSAWMDAAPAAEEPIFADTQDMGPGAELPGEDTMDIAALMDAAGGGDMDFFSEEGELPSEAEEFAEPDLPVDTGQMEAAGVFEETAADEGLDLTEEVPPPPLPGQQEMFEAWMEGEDPEDTIPDTWSAEPEMLDEMPQLPPEVEPETLDETPELPPEVEPETLDETPELPPEVEPETVDETSELPTEVEPETLDEMTELPTEVEPETVDETSELPTEVEPETVDETPELPPEVEPETVDETPELPPEVEPETLDETAELPPEMEPETLDETAELPPEVAPETLDEAAELPPEVEPETLDEMPELPPEVEPETLDEMPELPPEAEPETLDEMPELPPEVEPETVDETAELPPEVEPETVDETPEAEPETAETEEISDFSPDTQLETADARAYYEQGVNEYGYEGTCGPTSIANSLNHLMGTDEFTENQVLTEAIQENLCYQDAASPMDSGGTTTDQFVQLYEHMNELNGGGLDIQRYEFDDVLSMEEVAQRLDEGSVVNVAVDADTLWGQSAASLMGTPVIEKSTDHWITVTGVERDAQGGITGFRIIDSGGGVDHVDAETYQTMCYGSERLHLDDPTCIVVSKKDPADIPPAPADEGPPVLPEASPAPGAGDLPPPDVEDHPADVPELASVSSFFQEMDADTLQRDQDSLERMSGEERRVYLDAVAAEPEITKDVLSVAGQTGSGTAGLEFRIKSPDSLMEKLNDRGGAADIHEINDILRFTQIFDAQDLAQGANESLARYESLGYTVQKVKNTWEDDTNPYNGINAALISPQGQRLEVQFHTEESFQVKNGPLHDLYAQWRVLPEDSDEAIELQNRMFALSRGQDIPARISEVRKT